MGLAPIIGRGQAHELVFTAAGRANDAGRTLRQELVNDPEIMRRLSEDRIDELIDPANYTGSAGHMVDTVVAKADRIIGAAP